MNKQQQIEELAKFMHYSAHGKDKNCKNGKCAKCWCVCKNDAELLYDAGYRKVTDGAVILMPEERDEEMKEINKTLAERDELKAKIERLKEVIADQNELCWNCKKSVKEFAEKVKEHAERSYDWDIAKIIISEVQIVLNTFLNEG